MLLAPTASGRGSERGEEEGIGKQRFVDKESDGWRVKDCVHKGLLIVHVTNQQIA